VTWGGEGAVRILDHIHAGDVGSSEVAQKPVAAATVPRTINYQLAQHERTIVAGLATFKDVGSALLAIRDGKLYRTAHKTFESYCQARWSFSRVRAHQLIEAAETDSVLTTVNKPSNEAQARPLSAPPRKNAPKLRSGFRVWNCGAGTW
jgi:hypothetical protein